MTFALVLKRCKNAHPSVRVTTTNRCWVAPQTHTTLQDSALGHAHTHKPVVVPQAGEKAFLELLLHSGGLVYLLDLLPLFRGLEVETLKPHTQMYS